MVRKVPRVASIFPVLRSIRSKVEVTSHHVHPVSDATVTAPHAKSEQSFRSALKNALATLKLFDASPCNSAAVGIFANTSPFCVKPAGGQLAAGDGITFFGVRFFFFFTTFFFTGFFFVTGFFVAFGEALAVALALAFTVGFGLGVDVAAMAEVVERIKKAINMLAIIFFNLCST